MFVVLKNISFAQLLMLYCNWEIFCVSTCSRIGSSNERHGYSYLIHLHNGHLDASNVHEHHWRLLHRLGTIWPSLRSAPPGREPRDTLWKFQTTWTYTKALCFSSHGQKEAQWFSSLHWLHELQHYRTWRVHQLQRVSHCHQRRWKWYQGIWHCFNHACRCVHT